MSKSPDLLTKPKFQVLAVSKKLDLLTEPIFQESAVSKKPVLLTGDSFLSYYGERLRDYVLMWKQSGDWLSVRAIFNRFFAFLLNIWPETQNFGLFLRFILSARASCQVLSPSDPPVIPERSSGHFRTVILGSKWQNFLFPVAILFLIGYICCVLKLYQLCLLALLNYV